MSTLVDVLSLLRVGTISLEPSRTAVGTKTTDDGQAACTPDILQLLLHLCVRSGDLEGSTLGPTLLHCVPFSLQFQVGCPASARTLRHHLAHNPGANLREIAYRVAKIVKHLHSCDDSQALVHGNINMDEIFLFGDAVLLTGFEHCGLNPVLCQDSPSPTEDLRDPPAGNITSLAPELIEKGRRTTQTDVYAFGMLVFEMYAGSGPFASINPRDPHRISAMVKLMTGKRPLRPENAHPEFTDGLWKLVTDCWEHDPAARPCMTNISVRDAWVSESRPAHDKRDAQQRLLNVYVRNPA
ncbi:hypothetical protein AURDEDRAFT_159398 [Auricularia subglabra TFB-10046 SS5]|nr:hypothetical protein AURDEDRAFT_159398 [Auricularia subglabra TFB-10046 SS5]